MIAAIAVPALLGALLLWWGFACRRGTFPRNRILGVRTPTILRDREAWVVAHRAGASYILIVGGGAVVATAIAAAFGLARVPFPAVPLTLTVGLVWVFAWLFVSFFASLRAARTFRPYTGDEQR